MLGIIDCYEERIWNNEIQEYEVISPGILKGEVEFDQYQYPGNYELVRVRLDDRTGNSQLKSFNTKSYNHNWGPIMEKKI